MGWIKTIIILCIILSLGYLAYIYYPQLNDFIGSTNYPEVSENPRIGQFEKNLRFENSNISYFINSNCDSSRRSRIIFAFDYLARKSQVLSFYQTTEEKADVVVGCSKESYQTEKNVFAAGEGGPTAYIQLKNYSLIKRGKIILYERPECDYPVVEMHELLHVLGFAHVNNKSSIMYPYANCKVMVDSDIITILQEIYSQEPLADLSFDNISAIKNNIYLNISFTVANYGLKVAKGINVKIKEIPSENIDMGELGQGEAREISIGNMRLTSASISELTLNIDYAEKEFDKENNIKVINLD
jgi:hypothetical protein